MFEFFRAVSNRKVKAIKMKVLLILAVFCFFQVSSGGIISVDTTNAQSILPIHYPKFYIESYGFTQGSTYPPNSDTVWRVFKSSSTVTKLTLNFKTFVLDGVQPTCAGDVLFIRGATVALYCGTQTGTTVTATFPATPAYLDLEFTSNATIQLKGFSILVTQS